MIFLKLFFKFIDNGENVNEVKTAVDGKNRDKIYVFGGTGLLPEQTITNHLW